MKDLVLQVGLIPFVHLPALINSSLLLILSGILFQSSELKYSKVQVVGYLLKSIFEMDRIGSIYQNLANNSNIRFDHRIPEAVSDVTKV